MQVRCRFLCADLPTQTEQGEVEVADGATVEEALRTYAALYGMEDTLDKLPESMFLIGKSAARLESVLQDQDELTVMRILHGG